MTVGEAVALAEEIIDLGQPGMLRAKAGQDQRLPVEILLGCVPLAGRGEMSLQLFGHAVAPQAAVLDQVDRAGDRDVILAYEQLWRSYQALRYEVERSDSRQAQVDLMPATQAFRDVVRDISDRRPQTIR